ncbi:MAG: hypothetical protein MUC60_18190 [Oscillatoria sp. Prado101]|nr:hypothetical protein [Oscillatoria sp. Prado101]
MFREPQLDRRQVAQEQPAASTLDLRTLESHSLCSPNAWVRRNAPYFGGKNTSPLFKGGWGYRRLAVWRKS